MTTRATITATTLRSIAADEEAITIAERADAQGAYFTPIQPTPSGRRTMAATLLTPTGPKTGPRYSSRALCEAAIAYSREAETADAN